MNRKFLFLIAASFLAVQVAAHSQGIFTAGDLLVSTSTYEDIGAVSTLVAGSSVLPGGQTADANGSFPEVFSNDTQDANFGVTSPIIIQQLTQSGSAAPIAGSSPYVSGNDFNVPTSVAVTSFSSKSELALNLSTDGSAITFMGYDAGANGGSNAVGQMDISNSNTPGDTNSGDLPPYGTTLDTYREVVELDANGNLNGTTTNAYSTNNGRAAILANGKYYTVGNGGAANLTGAEIVTPGVQATSATLGTTVLGQYVYSGDNNKNGKDNNFRAIAIANNVLYVDKGSGSKGVDTVYQVGAGTVTGTNNVLPTGTSNTISVLPGMPGSSQATGYVATNAADFTPFGIFVTGTTMYVADEGLAAPNPGTDVFNSGTESQAANYAFAGLTKWTYNGTVWNYDYTLNSGLNLGVQYGVAGSVPGYSSVVSGTLDPMTVGLRALAGEVNGNGTVTLFATTATLSDLGDVGADPNKLVSITDDVADTSSAQVTGESFNTLETAAPGEVIRGVTLAPTAAVPEPGTWGMAVGGLGVLLAFGRARRRRG